jgi:hypothetical protein
MAQIYSKARRVFSWLSPEDEDLYKMIKVFNFFSDGMNGLPLHAEITGHMEDGYLQPLPPLHGGQQMWRQSDYYTWLERHCSVGGPSSHNAITTWRIMTFFKHRY